MMFFQRYNQQRGLVSSFSPLAVPAPAPGWLMWNRGSSAISAPWRFQGACWGQLVNCRNHLMKCVSWSGVPKNLLLVRVAADFTCPTCNSGEIESFRKKNLCKCPNGRIIVLYVKGLSRSLDRMPQLLSHHAPRHLFLLTINLTSLDRCGPFKSTKKYKQYQTGAWSP